jgi:hypothetical protein
MNELELHRKKARVWATLMADHLLNEGVEEAEFPVSVDGVNHRIRITLLKEVKE